VDGTGSMTGFDISGVGSLGSAIIVLVICN
jgi:hypothetical protein